jgi:hypothetical protein
MTIKEFNRLQKGMSNAELIEIAQKQVSKLAKTGGESFTMTVPPRVTDTDMIFSELI